MNLRLSLLPLLALTAPFACRSAAGPPSPPAPESPVASVPAEPSDAETAAPDASRRPAEAGTGTLGADSQAMRIHVPNALLLDEPVRRAVEELFDACEAKLPQRPVFVDEAGLERLGAELVLGVIDESPLGARFAGLPGAGELTEDGFLLRSATFGEGTTLVAVGQNMRGAIYAAYELARRARLERWTPGTQLDELVNPAFAFRLCSIYDNPGEARFDTIFRDPEVVLRMGFNGIITNAAADICTFDAIDPTLYPAGGQDRKLILKRRERIAGIVRAAKANHLKVFFNGDQIAFPKGAFKYGDEITADGPGGRVLFSAVKPKVHELIAATYEELLGRFPEIDGIQVRTGEVYAKAETSFLAGNNPTHASDELSKDWSHEDKVAGVVETVRKVVVEQYGKHYNHRTWGYYQSPHTQTDLFLDIANRFEPDPNFTFSFKHSKTDYWRYNALNPNFGQGKHNQWAEFQMAREYEGKGAFPTYLGRLFADGPTEIAPTGGLTRIHELGVRGAWCWARGGGWGGPFPAREDWVDLNTYAFVRLLWDPSQSPWQIAKDWCVLRMDTPLDSPALAHFVEIQRLSEEALLKTRYVEAFAERGYLKNGSGWSPLGNWSRDDKIGRGVDAHPASLLYVFLEKDGTVDRAIAEKERAIAATRELIGHFKAILTEFPEDRDWQELFNTALYGQTWVDTFAHHIIAGLEALKWRDSGKQDEALRESALKHLRQAQKAWRDHTTRVPRLPGVATPYKELGLSGEWRELHTLLVGG